MKPDNDMTSTTTDRHRRSAGLLLLGAGALVLSACGGTGRSDRPAEVVEGAVVPSQTSRPPPAGRSPSASGSETQIAAYRPPAQPSYARPEPKRAVAALMRRADDQRASGDLDAATVSLERALRIAPEEPTLWHKLAEVRNAQQRPELVVQLAAKSNALANPQDRQLRSDNWRLIAGARRALGDNEGAREAERRAASYE
jgi:tetratricopeptide (TPR) repeat protein